ncbi:hypothetical protein P9112_006419 [Eukaryota sp. TZLM1-RC]
MFDSLQWCKTWKLLEEVAIHCTKIPLPDKYSDMLHSLAKNQKLQKLRLHCSDGKKVHCSPWFEDLIKHGYLDKVSCGFVDCHCYDHPKPTQLPPCPKPDLQKDCPACMYICAQKYMTKKFNRCYSNRLEAYKKCIVEHCDDVCSTPDYKCPKDDEDPEKKKSLLPLIFLKLWAFYRFITEVEPRTDVEFPIVPEDPFDPEFPDFPDDMLEPQFAVRSSCPNPFQCKGGGSGTETSRLIGSHELIMNF